MNGLRTSLLILQPTPLCNIDCKYCYLSNRSSKATMSPATVSAVMENLRQSDLLGFNLTVVWHVGEPLVLSPSYYDEVLGIVNSYSSDEFHIRHSIQSNLTLLTPEHCDVFKRHGVRMGVSLDGPKKHHDAMRVDRKGNGTFDRVMDGISLLRERNIGFNVISVITSNALDDPKGYYEFIREVGMDEVAFNIDESEGVNGESSYDSEEVEEKYKKFLREVIRQSIDREDKFSVREFRFLDQLFRNGKALEGNSQAIPFSIVSVAHDGSFSTFSPELVGQSNEEYKNFILGNAHKELISSTLNTELFKRLNADIQHGVEDCKANCSYFEFCGGGAPSNKHYENGSFRSTETSFCRLTYKMPLDVYVELMEYKVG